MSNGNSHLKIRSGPSGLHLFNRKTGINVLIDEIKTSASLWSTAPRQVSVALTNACDLVCAHCYAPKNLEFMDFERATGWLAELDDNGCIGVGFGGGEPTLYPRFSELCSFTAKNTKLAVTMTTHGHNLSDRLLDDLVGNLHFVRVSMDGVGHTYESIRLRSFDSLVKGMVSLGKIAPLGINFLVNSKTIDDLDDALQLAEQLAAVEILLIPEEPVRGVGGIDDETFMLLRRWVTGYSGSVRLSVSENYTDVLPTCNPFGAEKGLSSFVHIDVTGIIKRSSFDTHGIKIVGNDVMAALTNLKKYLGEM